MSIYTGEENGTLTINPGGNSDGLMEVVLPGFPWGGDLDLMVLWTLRALRGSNKPIGAVDGQRPYRRILDEATADLELTVVGDCDPDGDPHTDTLIGLETNVDWLFVNLDRPPTGATRDAVLVKPSGSEHSAVVQTEFRAGRHLDLDTAPAVLTITLIEGLWTAEGS